MNKGKIMQYTYGETTLDRSNNIYSYTPVTTSTGLKIKAQYRRPLYAHDCGEYKLSATIQGKRIDRYYTNFTLESALENFVLAVPCYIK